MQYLGHSTLEKEIFWRLFKFSRPLPTGKIWTLNTGKSEKYVLDVLRKRSGSPLSHVKLTNFFRPKLFFIDAPSFSYCGITQKKKFQESGWVCMDSPIMLPYPKR